MAVSSCSGSPCWTPPPPLLPTSSQPCTATTPVPQEQLISTTITPTFRNASFALQSLSIKKHLEMLREEKGGKKSFPSKESQQDPSVSPPEKNWEPHSATGRGNSNTLHSSDTSMLFPVLQICLQCIPIQTPPGKQRQAVNVTVTQRNHCQNESRA